MPTIREELQNILTDLDVRHNGQRLNMEQLERLGPNAQITVEGNPMNLGFMIHQVAGHTGNLPSSPPDAYQRPEAPRGYHGNDDRNVMHEQPAGTRYPDMRKPALGTTQEAAETGGAALGLAATGAGIGAAIAGPPGAAIGAGAGALGAGIKWGIDRARDWSKNEKIKYHQNALENLLENADKSDPKIQAMIKDHQAKLNEYVPGQLAPGQELLPTGQQELVKQGFTPEGNVPGTTNPAGSAGMVPNQPTGNWWEGQRAYAEQVPRFTPLQQAYQATNIKELLENPADFNAIRNNEIKRFHEDIAPAIAEQYYGRNPQSFGSAYPEALGRGGASLAERLAAMQSKFEAEREQRRMQAALEPSFESVYNPRVPGVKEELAKTALNKGIDLGGELIGEGMRSLYGSLTKRLSTPSYSYKAGQTKITPSGIYTPITTAKAAGINDQGPAQIAPVNQSVYNQPEPLTSFGSKGNYSGAAGQDALQRLLMQSAEKSNARLGGRTR